MAGTTVGNRAPSPFAVPDKQRQLYRVPAVTRTRRNHGVFLLGDKLATVDSSRRAGEGHSVTLTVGNGVPLLTGSMTPAQARAMSRALLAAADAADGQPASPAPQSEVRHA